MSPSIPFTFNSTPSVISEFDATMSCYEGIILGCGMSCQDCSRFITTRSMTPPLSTVSDTASFFDFTSSSRTKLPALKSPSTLAHFTSATKQSRWNWAELGVVEPSTKTSRFNRLETDISTSENASENFIPKHEGELPSNCPVCSMVPYGALCSNCDQIQTSEAIALATPPAAAWPVANRLGDWEGTKALEESLLQNLDMELFERINVPHEVDEWGRRVYNDCGHRILYYQDSDGDTVMGFEAWYPSSVTGDYEEPDDFRAGRQTHDVAMDNEAQDSDYDDCGLRVQDPADFDEVSIVSEYDGPMLDFEQQRFAEFLAARDEELAQFQSDRERIASWIATSSVAGHDGVSV